MYPNQQSIVPQQPQQETQAPQNTNPQYDYVGAETQIGAGKFGVKPLAQHGTILIGGGQLWLLGSQNQVIAQAPLGLCTVKKGPWITFGQLAWLTIQGVRYSIAVGHGKTLGKKARKGVFMTRRETQAFIRSFQLLTHTA